MLRKIADKNLVH